MPQQNISKIGIGTNDFIIKDETLTNNVTNLIEIISGNNNSIVNRINDLNNRAFDAEIKISSVNESEISNIVDGLYKVKYITITGEGDNATETLNNSAVLIQKGTNQYLIKDGQISSRTKTDNTWSDWETSQADWNETDLTKPSYIKNKPELPIDYSKEYLTFVALEDGTFSFTMQAKLTTDAVPSMSYSTDNGETWTTVENVNNEEVVLTTPTILAGDKVLWKSDSVQYGTNPDISNSTNLGYGRFSSTGEFNIEGNIMSLIYNDDFTTATSFKTPVTTGVDAGIFARLFLNTQIFSAEHLKLPATTLVNNCYRYMFYGCTSLVTAPTLPATTLADSCYRYMFYGCTSLTTAPQLPATTLTSACYQYMFKGCTSLTTAPALPATALANSCYTAMFEDCTSLMNAPALPATILSVNCYVRMFYNCKSLITAPELPATTLSANCYGNMFNGCNKLNYIKAMFTTTPGNNYTINWVAGVAGKGTFVKNATTTWNVSDVRGANGIPNGWNVYTEDEYELVRHYELETNISSTLSTNKFTKINNNEINQILIPIDKSKNNYNGDLLSNTTIIPYISNAEKYLALQIGNVIQNNYIIVESNLIGKGFYSNTSILYNNGIAQIYPTLPLNLIKDNLQYLMLSYYTDDIQLYLWFDDYANGSTNMQDLDEWVTNKSETEANDWDDYVENYLLEDYPNYKGANCYHYTGETYTWEGEEYYLWKRIITGNQEPMEYILTNTINYNELYSHSLESDSSNHWCPYMVKFNEDDDNEYTAENSDDILIKVSNNYVL